MLYSLGFGPSSLCYWAFHALILITVEVLSFELIICIFLEILFPWYVWIHHALAHGFLRLLANYVFTYRHQIDLLLLLRLQNISQIYMYWPWCFYVILQIHLAFTAQIYCESNSLLLFLLRFIILLSFTCLVLLAKILSVVSIYQLERCFCLIVFAMCQIFY